MLFRSVAAATVAELVMLPALLVVADDLAARFPPPWPDRLVGRRRQGQARVAAGTTSARASTARTI